MKASGSGRTPENFSIAASTSSVGGVAVGILAGGQRLGLLPPLAAGDVGEQLEQHVGRGRRARRRRSARRAACGRRSGNPAARRARRAPHRPAPDRCAGRGRRHRRPCSRGRLSARSNSMCQVSFSEPGLLSRVRETKVASTGLSRERPASPAGVAGAGCSAGRARRRSRQARRRSPRAAPSACGRFPCRPARTDSAAPPSCRTARRRSPRSCSRTGRNPAGPSPPSCGAAAAGLRRASCARRAAWSGRARARRRRRRRSAADIDARHQRRGILRRQRGWRRLRAGRRRSR